MTSQLVPGALQSEAGSHAARGRWIGGLDDNTLPGATRLRVGLVPGDHGYCLRRLSEERLAAVGKNFVCSLARNMAAPGTSDSREVAPYSSLGFRVLKSTLRQYRDAAWACGTGSTHSRRRMRSSPPSSETQRQPTLPARRRGI